MKKYKKHYFLKNRRNKNLKQNILDKLHRLFDGITDAIKVTYYASKSQEIMKFEMLGHNITEENGVIRIIDDSDIRFFTPKTVIIDLSNVKSVTYESDKTDDKGIHYRNVTVMMKDGNRIEMETVAFG